MSLKLNRKRIVIGGVLGITIILFIVTVWISAYFYKLSQQANISIPYLFRVYHESSEKMPLYTTTPIRFLILGLDQRSDSLENTLLTDTMLYGSLNVTKSKLTIVPIPRDIWIADLKTKVNSLYYYGTKQSKTSAPEYTESMLRQYFGITPNFFLTINYAKLQTFIDLLGGVDVAIADSFVDPTFPNPAYVEHTSDPSISPYISISFREGTEHMDGNRALMFIRSRTSANPEEAGDSARSNRQMFVIQSMLAKLRSRETLTNPELLGKLYRFWHEAVGTNAADSDVLALVRALGFQQPTIVFDPIPTTETDSDAPLLFHPPVFKYGLWVWEPIDPSWKTIQAFFGN